LSITGTYRVSYTTLDELVLAYSEDLARGGIFVSTPHPPGLDAVVRIHLELPGDGGLVSVLGRVVHVNARPPGMGVEFIEEDAGWIERIEAFIARQGGSRAERSGPVPLSPMLKVLIVEDDEGYRDLLAQLFRTRGDRVRMAGDGIEALAMCLKETPDVILSDVQMPRMDGWQLLRVLRGRPAFQMTPVVFLTTLENETARLSGYQLGVDDYIPKPARTEEIVARVDRAVQRALQAPPEVSEVKTLHGDLEQVSLPAVLTLLEIEKKTGALVVDGEGTGRVLFRDGRPIRVELYGGEGAPPELISVMLTWKKGTFEFLAEDVEGEDEIENGVMQLLLEAARSTDEKKRG
jgi:CheY-like chemotaxis protein/Tfp pilus assembly protein PilZ